MFLITLGVAMCASYFVMGALFSYFFRGQFPQFSLKKSVRSVLLIALFVAIIFTLSISIPNPELSNRALHAFGGGLMVVLVFFFAVRDFRLPVNTFQFIILSILIATSLGVANEIAEFLLQEFFNITFAKDLNDTWLDLVSNVVGTAIGVGMFAPFVSQSRHERA